MNSKQKRTLVAVFSDPVSGTIEWAAIESLLIAAGCRVMEGAGSRVRFVHGMEVESFHRPHPAKEAKRYQVRGGASLSGPSGSRTMSTMTYKGYSAAVEFDADDEIFFGKLAGIRDGVGFHADTVAKLKAAFREAVDDYIETCARLGKSPDKPYSGKVMFRVDPEVHARVAKAAELSGRSLNAWAEDALRRAADEDMAKVVAV